MIHYQHVVAEKAIYFKISKSEIYIRNNKISALLQLPAQGAAAHADLCHMCPNPQILLFGALVWVFPWQLPKASPEMVSIT